MLDTELCYAADLTQADLDRARDFLAPWLEAEAFGQGDNPSSRVARSMLMLLRHTHADLSVRLQRIAHDPTSHLADRRDLVTAWNRLAAMLEPWAIEPGYDRARWRYLSHYDAQSETDERHADGQIRTRMNAAGA